MYYSGPLKECLVLLGESWKIVDQYAAVEVRESGGFLTRFLPPAAIFRLLSRFTGTSLSVSAIRKLGDLIDEATEQAKEKIIVESS